MTYQPKKRATVHLCSNRSIWSIPQIPHSNRAVTKNPAHQCNGKAYAFMAKIVSGTIVVPQGVVGNPVQLTVGKTTRLLLNVTRDSASSNHTIQGWLKYNSTSQGVGDKWINIKVNETVYSVKTDGSGHFVKSVGLQPLNNTATLFVISASFNGDTAINATAWSKTLEGTAYPRMHNHTIQRLQAIIQQHQPNHRTTSITSEAADKNTRTDAARG